MKHVRYMSVCVLITNYSSAIAHYFLKQFWEYFEETFNADGQRVFNSFPPTLMWVHYVQI